MTAKELIAILEKNIDKKIILRYGVEVRYSDWTSGIEDQLVDLNSDAILLDSRDGEIIFAADLCS